MSQGPKNPNPVRTYGTTFLLNLDPNIRFQDHVPLQSHSFWDPCSACPSSTVAMYFVSFFHPRLWRLGPLHWDLAALTLATLAALAEELVSALVQSHGDMGAEDAGASEAAGPCYEATTLRLPSHIKSLEFFPPTVDSSFPHSGHTCLHAAQVLHKHLALPIYQLLYNINKLNVIAKHKHMQ